MHNNFGKGLTVVIFRTTVKPFPQNHRDPIFYKNDDRTMRKFAVNARSKKPLTSPTARQADY